MAQAESDLTPQAASEPIADYRRIWAEKPVLRAVYGDLFARMLARRAPGPALEIGGGVGGLKALAPDILASDIQPAPWLDLVADAQALPFANGALSTIFLLDVLHHVEFPARFFREAARVLRPGGRVVMIEPAITPGSQAFYRFIHQEPVRMRADPLIDGAPDPARDPYDSNQAIPTLIATRNRTRFHAAFPQLRITEVSWFSFLAYPLSGGFQRWSALPAAAAKPLLAFERALERPLGRAFGFRMLLTIERL
ncbi:MAG: class I SAM-dependent methyltransferase [Hyphomonadaceae bacterium]